MRRSGAMPSQVMQLAVLQQLQIFELSS